MGKPWQSHEEFLVDQALEAAISDPETIRSIRPAHPQILFPETRGMTKMVAGINDILSIDRYAASNRSWLSGMPVRRTELASGEWTGTGRYSMESLG